MNENFRSLLSLFSGCLQKFPDYCQGVTCGTNAECKIVNGNADCVCNIGFQGNAYLGCCKLT